MSIFNIEMDQQLTSRLARLATRRDVSSAEIAQIAITEFVDREEAHIEEIEAAILEADRGDFASDDEVAAVFGKHLAATP